ncbi:MAG: PP2C family protein-serine/threonine phosphatase [Calditrichia bacterium]
MNKLRFLAVYGTLIAISAFIIFNIYPVIYPDASVRLTLKKHQIEQRAYELMDFVDIDVSGFHPSVSLEHDAPMLRFTQKSLGLKEANVTMSDEIPVYRWKVRWITDSGWSNLLQASNSNTPRTKHIRNMELEFQTNGNLLLFKQELPDSVITTGLTKNASRKRADALLTTFSELANILPIEKMAADSTDINASPQNKSSDDFSYRFSGKTAAAAPFDSIEVSVVTVGERFTSFEKKYNVPKRFEKASGFQPSNVAFPLLLALVLLSTVIIALKRWRSYEMDFRMGIVLGIVGGFGFAVFIFLQSYRFAPLLQAIVSSLINWVFVGGSLIFVWAVGESLAREVWANKFIPMDLIRNRYWLHSRIGRNVIRGIALGCCAFAGWLLLIILAQTLEPLSVRPGLRGVLAPLSSTTPLLRLITLALFFVFWAVSSYVVFGSSIIYKYLKMGIPTVLIVTVIYVLAIQEEVEPFGMDFLISFLPMFLLVWSFYRYNIITAFVGIFTMNLLTPGLALLYTGSNDISGYLLLGSFAGALVYGVVTLFTKDRVSDFKRLAPVYTKNISERERMQKELEIARDVQMSFLPHDNPAFKALDVASRCEPALEVGGDYFDFVELGDNKLGICIGDVSGKGTQAAFYMTLTKGFLRALASGSDSPAEVLTKLNALFYDNVKRGVFISMIYGIFDMANGTLTMARAGHNPVLMHKGRQIEMQTINPRGIAIGMEKGITFGKTIQEVTVPLQKDDLFIFYTDGFPEAMNKDREEFGDERFEQAIDKLSENSSEGILDGIFKEVRRFTRSTPQHDDMTIVVVRVNELAATSLPVVS